MVASYDDAFLLYRILVGVYIYTYLSDRGLDQGILRDQEQIYLACIYIVGIDTDYWYSAHVVMAENIRT